MTIWPPSFFRRSEITRVMWHFRRELAVVALFSLVANVLMLTPTLYMLQVYDRVLSSRSELTLLVLSLVTLFFYLVMAFSEWMRSRVLVRAGMQFDDRLSKRVFDAAFDAQLDQGRGPVQQVFNDLIQLRQFLTGNGVFAIMDTPWVPVYLLALFLLHPWLGYTAIVFAFIQSLVAWWGHQGAIAPAEAVSKANVKASSYLQAKLRNAEVVESLGMVGNLLRHWSTRHQDYMVRNEQSAASNERINAVSKFIQYSQQSLALGMGAVLVIRGELSMGAMIAANVLTARALAPISMIAGMWRGFLTAAKAFERLEALLNAHPPRDAALKRVKPKGLVRLENVLASAPARSTPILKGLSLQVRPGQVTVVMGPSGSGKSTLARVMLGIWPDVSGEVLLDGLPLGSWDRSELGPHIGYLPQDVELFEGTIAENVCRFSQMDSEKVIAAAQTTGLHEVILRLPKGYDTPIGEAGSLLSGGQRQRLGLARAVYGDPVLIVLDEPNANLDDAGETALMAAIQSLKQQGKTVVLISHRPGALAAADQVIMMRDGQIEVSGPRDQVLAALRQAQSAAAGAGKPLPA